MVLILSDDIIADGPKLSGAHRESPIALLPAEGFEPDFFVNPSRGHRFYLPQDIGKPVGGFQSDEKMNVVRNSTNFLRDTPELIDHAAKK